MDAAMEAEAKAALLPSNVAASTRRGSFMPINTRSPLGATLNKPKNLGDESDDTRNLLGSSRQPSPAPTPRSFMGEDTSYYPN